MSEFITTLSDEQFNMHKHILDGRVFYRKTENGVLVKTSLKSAIEYLQKIKKHDKKD